MAIRAFREKPLATRWPPGWIASPSRDSAAADPSARPGAMAAGPGVIKAASVTMDQVVTYLNRIMDLPVIDQTGLRGTYAFQLKFAPDSTRPLASVPPADGALPEPAATGDPSSLPPFASSWD